MLVDDIKSLKEKTIDILNKNDLKTVTKVIETVFDKQIPQDAIEEQGFYGNTYYCPSCKKIICRDTDCIINFCANCGQRLSFDGVWLPYES